MRDSLSEQIILYAYRIGYRVTKDGIVISPNFKVIKTRVSTNGRLVFSVNYKGTSKNVLVHRLQGFQKFGPKIFDETLEVRHLNSNCLDNTLDNIGIGNHAINQEDSKVNVLEYSKLGGKKLRRFSDEDISDIRMKASLGISLKEIGTEYGIGKGHVSDIVNKKLYKD